MCTFWADPPQIAALSSKICPVIREQNETGRERKGREMIET